MKSYQEVKKELGDCCMYTELEEDGSSVTLDGNYTSEQLKVIAAELDRLVTEEDPNL